MAHHICGWTGIRSGGVKVEDWTNVRDKRDQDEEIDGRRKK
jgi:hypothetical protein